MADPLRTAPLKAGDHILMDAKSGYLLEKLPKSEVEDLALEEVPDIGYDDTGGLTTQIEAIKDAVELPYLYADYYKEHQPPPQGRDWAKIAGKKGERVEEVVATGQYL